MPPPFPPQQVNPRQRFGRIDARPKNPRWMGGGKFDILQNRDVSAFQDPRRPGMSVHEIAEDASRMGYTVGPGGVLRRDGLQPSAAAPTREQNIAAAKAAGTFEEIRRKYNRENPGKRMNKRGDIIDVKEESADKTKAGGVAAPRGSATARAGRGALPDDRPSVASANARQRFFGSAKTTSSPPLAPAPAATVTPSPAPATAPAATASPPPTVETPAMRRQMMRDAAMGRSETRTDGKITGIQSKYGTGGIGFLKPGEARPVSMTTDEFGKPETMTSYLARRKAIQASKGITFQPPKGFV